MRALVFFLAAASCKGPGATSDSGTTMPSSSAKRETAFPVPSVPLVPADWPADVPIYPGVHLATIHVKPDADGGTVRTADFETSATIDVVSQFYRTAFPRATKLADMNILMARELEFAQGNETIEVIVTNIMGATQVTLTVTEIP